jgi:hypothetical protein
VRNVVVVIGLFGLDQDYVSQHGNIVRMIVNLVGILKSIPVLEIRNDGVLGRQ